MDRVKKRYPRLSSAGVSKGMRYKCCIVVNSKAERGRIISTFPTGDDKYTFRFGVNPRQRTMYSLFVYFKKLEDAVQLRERLYDDDRAYVFIQDDKALLKKYRLAENCYTITGVMSNMSLAELKWPSLNIFQKAYKRITDYLFIK